MAQSRISFHQGKTQVQQIEREALCNVTCWKPLLAVSTSRHECGKETQFSCDVHGVKFLLQSAAQSLCRYFSVRNSQNGDVRIRFVFKILTKSFVIILLRSSTGDTQSAAWTLAVSKIQRRGVYELVHALTQWK